MWPIYNINVTKFKTLEIRLLEEKLCSEPSLALLELFSFLEDKQEWLTKSLKIAECGAAEV
jgi:hypothetical protein